MPTHAYDFITSWDQAVTAANQIVPGGGLLANVNECGPEPSSDPQGYLTTCAALHSGGFSTTADLPDAMGNPTPSPGPTVSSRIANYEFAYGNRQLKIYGNAAFSGTATVTFNGYSGTDQDANYTITWTSASTEIVIEFATHIAVGLDVLGNGVGYGPGLGAGNISGGPYHVNLYKLDGASLGSQDNQLKGADIFLPPPPCGIAGPAPVCAGSQSTYTYNPWVSIDPSMLTFLQSPINSGYLRA